MALEVADRVLVTDQTSQYRGRYGSVMSEGESPILNIRLDGHADAAITPFPAKSLMASTQPCPIDYPTVPTPSD